MIKSFKFLAGVGALIAIQTTAFADAQPPIGKRLLQSPTQALAQSLVPAPVAQGGEVPELHGHDEIDPAERERIWSEINRNIARLKLRENTDNAKAASVKPFALADGFSWPVRNAKGNSDASYWVIPFYLDQNRSSASMQDFQCQQRTYEGHKGTDISLGWDAWNVMASEQIQVIAAAAGVITYRTDGNFDRNCKNSTKLWNAIYLRHDDGSITWYGHLKTGTLTTKQIGDRVERGEFLGAIGSSGNSSGPHLHFEVYDPQGQLVDPWAGQCNTINSANTSSAWRDQKPYVNSQLNRLYTASLPPVFPTCGGDGTLADAGRMNEKRDFKPGDSIIALAVYRDQQSAQITNYKITKPDGSVWKQWSHSPSQSNAQQSYVSSYWFWNYVLETNAPSGTWMVEAVFEGKTVSTSFTVSPNGDGVANYSSLWWNAQESGWGVSITQQANILFAAWFTYDADSTGLWLVMPSAALQPDGSFKGEIYRTTGIPLARINGAESSTSVKAVGSGTLRFTSGAIGVFSYTVDTGAGPVTQSKTITRQTFGSLPNCRFTTGSRKTFTNYQDLWWNPKESGWGISLTHQADTIFAAWFTYRADGKGQWLVGSAITKTPLGDYKGRLYRTTGMPFAAINGAAANSSVSDVGEISFSFIDGENAQMRYTVDGVSQTKSITRQNFAALVSACQ